MLRLLRILLFLAAFTGASLGAWAKLKPVTYTGTGFVVHPDGFLLTCAHLIDFGMADKITVTLDGKRYDASVLDYDNSRDLALLQIQAQGLPALPLADSNTVRLGEEIRAVGFPLQDIAGVGIKMTRGSIAGITSIRTQKTFQIDAPVNDGNSGGPIVNDRGEAVGIVNAKLKVEGIEGVGFAVPVNYARTLLRNEFIDLPPAPAQGEKLDGPTLAERVTPAVAFLTVETTEWEMDEDDEQPYVADVVRAKRSSWWMMTGRWWGCSASSKEIRRWFSVMRKGTFVAHSNLMMVSRVYSYGIRKAACEDHLLSALTALRI